MIIIVCFHHKGFLPVGEFRGANGGHIADIERQSFDMVPIHKKMIYYSYIIANITVNFEKS